VYEFIRRTRSTLNAQRPTLKSEFNFWTWVPGTPRPCEGASQARRFPEALISRQDTAAFRRSLLRWYRRHGRDLPWRQTRDPYVILVSEVMLQQTQVASVIPYYNEWLRRFPDLAALATASESNVLQAWQGLGYYARARNLRAAARAVQDRHDGRFPRDPDTIRELPGVGRYTANAVVSFAFDRSVPIVEANTARVLARLFDVRTPIDQSSGRTALWDHATSLIPKTSSRTFNSALIDLGALICLPRPKCGVCPVKKFCGATNPELLPRKKQRPPLKNLTESHAFVIRRDRILLEQSGGRWRGMWILPPLRLRAPKRRPIHTSTFPFTHHRVTLRVFRKVPYKIDNDRQRWFPIRALGSIPLPSPHRRALVALLRSNVETFPYDSF